MHKLEQFSLQKLVTEFNLNPAELAKILFPHVKYPILAFNRVLSGEASLDTDQLQNLASFLGMFVSELFNVEGWKSKSQPGQLFFMKDKYNAICHVTTGVISLFCEGDIVDTYIMSPGLTSVSEFINSINKQILEYEASLKN